MDFHNVSVFLLASLLVWLLQRFFRALSKEFWSPLRALPGPTNPSRLLGNLKEALAEDNIILHDQWTTRYGKTLKFNGLLNTSWLYTSDMTTLQHVLRNTDIYCKPGFINYQLGQLAGLGVLVVEGHEHKKQRRVMNPAFGVPQIREVTQVFVEKSIQLRDGLAVASSEHSGSMDVLPWISRATLDMIGLGGFNHDFNMLANDDQNDELNKGLAQLFHSETTHKILPFLYGLFPILRILPVENGAVLRRVQNILHDLGKQLLATAKSSDTSGAVGRDIISLLIRSNMSVDLPEHERLSDKDVVAQVPTMLVAGHETTSASLSWAMYRLSSHPDIQKKLREELFTIDTDEPTMDQLASLGYLDNFIREVLRVHPAIQMVPREATRDDVLPLESPVTDTNGVVHSQLRISKGQMILVPITGINTDRTIWGEDFSRFRPERWDNIPKAASSIPGSIPNLMSFWGGHRNCIGMRFALVEMKAVIFTLIRAFELELAVPMENIAGKTDILQFPMVKNDKDTRAQLPLYVRSHVRT